MVGRRDSQSPWARAPRNRGRRALAADLCGTDRTPSRSGSDLRVRFARFVPSMVDVPTPPGTFPRPEPSAQGTLGKDAAPPLAHLRARARAQSGTIGAHGARGVRGHDSSSSTGSRSKQGPRSRRGHLGRVLLELGVVTEEQLDQTLRTLAAAEAAARPGTPPRGRLHRRGAARARAARAARAQAAGARSSARRDSVQLLRLLRRLASYGGDGHVGIDPAPIIWAAIREAPPWEHVHATLTKVGAARVRLTPTAETARFAFDKAERATVDILPQPRDATARADTGRDRSSLDWRSCSSTAFSSRSRSTSCATRSCPRARPRRRSRRRRLRRAERGQRRRARARNTVP